MSTYILLSCSTLIGLILVLAGLSIMPSIRKTNEPSMIPSPPSSPINVSHIFLNHENTIEYITSSSGFILALVGLSASCLSTCMCLYRKLKEDRVTPLRQNQTRD